MATRREIQVDKLKQGVRYAPWSGLIWRACKKYSRPDIGIPVLENPLGQFLTGKAADLHMTTYLRNQWGMEERKLAPLPSWVQLSTASPQLVNDILNAPINMEEVHQVLHKAKLHTSPGPDLIPYDIWKIGGATLEAYLVRLFEYVRVTHQIPTSWKESDIKWLYKKGSRLQMSNYRPIALSNTLSKLFIKIFNT